jgi:hypothetical protein
MKRVLTAAVVGGLMIFAAPHGAWADPAPDHHGDCGAKTEQSAGPSDECAGQPEGGGDADHKPAPDKGDRRENHDGDDGSILF